ncbi:mitochondrial carrier domain-containing protein [Leucosporidium creatinivorum]|uniref:Mitochondrial carrier domain-containing protein n=1 Tax=Leucosporidium creatinivorum TaxID=106004 RepID=A0A1Y2D8G4_9BASI|nr:mitochondrial carrier domain-containing protein [Leucosporidium creatinivorum]
MAPSSTPAEAEKPSAPRAYPFWLGGAAASWAAVCTHPLDVAKVRMQTSKSNGMLNTLTESVKRDGFRRGAYAGLSASILRQMTYSLTRFGVYDALKERMSVPGQPLPAWKMAIAASIAGGLGGIAGNPADVVLVRMTSDANKPKAEQLKYKNCFDGVLRIVKDEGVAHLFRGVGPNVARAVLMNASQLATYDVFKTGIMHANLMEDGLGLHFTSSFLAGTVATTICAPFDVIKSRMMNAAGSEGVVSVITRSFKTEGVTWMFRGWTPAWIRLSPNTIIIFMTLEQMKRGVDYLRG